MLLFFDSAEHYTQATALQKYTSGGCGAVSTLYGRHGKGVQNPFLHKAFADPEVGHGTFRIGGAVYLNSGGMIYAVTDLDSYPLFSCNMRGDGAATVGIFGGASAASEPDVFRVGQWHYVEFGGTITIINGPPYFVRQLSDVIVRIDGDELLTVSGVMGTDVGGVLGNHSPFGWNGVRRGGHLTVDHWQDDFYVLDGAGSAPWNDFLGNKRMGAIFPNGLFQEEWTPGSGTGSNWERVDENDAPNNDVDFVTASGDGPLDLHEMQDVDTNDTLQAIQVLVSAKRSNDGFAFLTPYLRQGSIEYPLRPRALSSTYFYRNRDILVLSPSGLAWSDSILNAIQAGYRRGEY